MTYEVLSEIPARPTKIRQDGVVYNILYGITRWPLLLRENETLYRVFLSKRKRGYSSLVPKPKTFIEEAPVYGRYGDYEGRWITYVGKKSKSKKKAVALEP